MQYALQDYRTGELVALDDSDQQLREWDSTGKRVGLGAIIQLVRSYSFYLWYSACSAHVCTESRAWGVEKTAS